MTNRGQQFEADSMNWRQSHPTAMRRKHEIASKKSRAKRSISGALTALLFVCCLVAGLLFNSGCTAESARIALEAQQRADLVQQTVFDRQNDALRILLYRDLLRRLADAGATLDDRQRAVVNAVWNDRDLFEFWTVQQERSRALRLIGVDSRLYSEQSIVDLFIKSLTTKIDRIGEHLAARAGAAVQAPTADETQGESR